ncbi:MAG: hypothetical protein U1F52_04745 [Burkholderiales bacterium]
MTFVSGSRGVGRTALVANLAVALARRGQNVCVLDSHDGAGSAAEQMGMRRPRDLAEVIRHDTPLDDLLLSGPEGIRLVRAVQGRRMLGDLDAVAEDRLRNAFMSLQPAVDFLLVDAQGEAVDTAASAAVASTEIVVVTSAGADGITHAYGLMKRLSREAGRRRFHVIVCRARAADHAQAVFENLESTARRFLSVSVTGLGWIPEDADLARASRLRQSVVCAFPESVSAAALGRVADTLIHWPYAGEDGLDGFVHRLVQASRTSPSATA